MEGVRLLRETTAHIDVISPVTAQLPRVGWGCNNRSKYSGLSRFERIERERDGFKFFHESMLCFQVQSPNCSTFLEECWSALLLEQDTPTVFTKFDRVDSVRRWRSSVRLDWTTQMRGSSTDNRWRSHLFRVFPLNSLQVLRSLLQRRRHESLGLSTSLSKAALLVYNFCSESITSRLQPWINEWNKAYIFN